MTATKIDGTAIAKSIREKIAKDIAEKQAKNSRYKPSLVIIQVGDRSDSSTYVRMKLKAAGEVWLAPSVIFLCADLCPESCLICTD